jgi:hypothetical protein|tara:strand:+ start:2143 stop:2559 length:417 start_codon:yes stop_codon:yes gene_type:complete
MKKTELVNIIKQAVREELRSSLPELLSEIKTQTNTQKIKSTKKRETDPVSLAKQVLKTEQTIKPQRTFSKNEAINKILNETVGGIPQEGSNVSSGMGQNFSDTNGNEVSLDALPDHVSNALTRNYSEVLNLVDKKKNG